jgi:hypothetical protein
MIFVNMANEDEAVRAKKVKKADKEDSIVFTITQSKESADLGRHYSQLHTDAEMSLSRVKDESGRYSEQYLIRQYVRAVFAMIEGVSYVMKQAAKSFNTKIFSAAELAMLSEESYDLNEKGEAYKVKKYQKLKGNIQFAFAMYAKSIGVIYTLNVQEKGWDSLMRSIKVRDRLMHPKKPGDLDVTDTEFKDVVAAHRWFFQKYAELTELSMKKWLRDAGYSSEAIRGFMGDGGEDDS